MLCLIDNYDSFTYNIVHYLNELDIDVKVILNDQLSVSQILQLNPDHILLSPGPGTPDESGISKELLIAAAKINIPVLGVCLGHEIIGEVFGGKVVHSHKVMHGKRSKIYHNNHDLFKFIPTPFNAARYHSLIVDKATLPACLEVCGWTETDDGVFDEIMAIHHTELPIIGVQFHPESILTDYGHQLIANFLQLDRNLQNSPLYKTNREALVEEQ